MVKIVCLGVSTPSDGSYMNKQYQLTYKEVSFCITTTNGNCCAFNTMQRVSSYVKFSPEKGGLWTDNDHLEVKKALYEFFKERGGGNWSQLLEHQRPSFYIGQLFYMGGAPTDIFINKNHFIKVMEWRSASESSRPTFLYNYIFDPSCKS